VDLDVGRVPVRKAYGSRCPETWVTSDGAGDRQEGDR
jgi:hypothetical protein